MCGICGIVSFRKEEIAPEQIRAINKVIKHRGPDDEGVFTGQGIGLGHTRLSIVDLSPAGHQPMFDATKRYCIIHNGEIYNHIEIKEELSPKYSFVSRTDTEVILYAYKEWGAKCLDRFNGMFAFAIYDSSAQILFLARDRFGVKPLYYYYDKDKFVFASEIKGILQILPQEKVPNDLIIYDYLVYNRTDHSDDTFFKHIKRIRHGHYVLIKNGNMAIHQWYKLQDKIHNPFKSPTEFKNTLIDSVTLRLRSDVPVGICLSGGLDSSSITSIATSVLKKNDIQTFSAVYQKGEQGDESNFIDLYKEDVLQMHKIFPTAYTLHEDLSSFIMCHNEPVPSTSPYAQFKVMELAKDKVKVLLDGQGADESLAGYHYFFGQYLQELLFTYRFSKFLHESFYYYKNFRSFYALKSLIFFLLPLSFKSPAKLIGRNYLRKDFYEQEKNNSILPNTLFNARSLQEALLYHFEFKLEHLLKWVDRNSMWFSIESRTPFLDYRLVEGTISLPSEMIIFDGMTKQILRTAMQGILYEKIRLRKDKIGFMTPEEEWFKNQILKKYFLEIINSDSFRKNPYINQKKCFALFNLHCQGKINISRDIWKWLNLELWLKHCSS